MKVLFSLLLLSVLFACSKPPGREDAPKVAALEPPAIQSTSLDPVLAQTIATARQSVLATPNADTWGKLGQAFDAAEYFAEAKVCYKRATELDPASARWLHLLALLELQDEPEQALEHFQRAAELAPQTNDAPRLRLAQALIERGSFHDARPHLEKLLAVNSMHPAARVEWARLELAANNPAAAAESLVPSLTNAYTAKAAALILAQARQRLGDAPGAAAAAQAAASMPKPFDWPDPYLREVQSLRADRQNLADHANMLMMRGRLDEADQTIQLLLSRSGQNPETLLLLGRLRIQQRQCADAAKVLERHLTLRTNSLQGHVQLGLARYCEGQWQQAANAFRSAIALKPDFAQAHFNLGLSLSRANDSAGAAAAFKDSLRAQPGDPNAHGALAEELLRLGRRPEALAEAQNALRLDPKQQRALRVRAALQQAN